MGAFNSFPDFSYTAAELSAYSFCIDVFTISLRSGSIIHFVPADAIAFEQWLRAHNVRNIRQNIARRQAIAQPQTLAVIGAFRLVRFSFSQQLRKLGFEVIIEAENGEDFFARMKGGIPTPRVCIMDITTPCIDDFMTAKRIKERYPVIKTLAYTTLYESSRKNLRRYGIDIIIDKSCLPEELRKHVQQLLGH